MLVLYAKGLVRSLNHTKTTGATTGFFQLQIRMRISASECRVNASCCNRAGLATPPIHQPVPKSCGLTIFLCTLCCQSRFILVGCWQRCFTLNGALGVLLSCIDSTASFDLVLRPLRCPIDSVVSNPIVRLARKTPVPDRRRQRHSRAIEDEFPIRRRQWCQNFAPAPAAA